MHVQGKRTMGCQWFYKHFDTSMRVEDKGEYILPAQLNERILFKARPEDNATFNLYLSVDCVNRRANTHILCCERHACTAHRCASLVHCFAWPVRAAGQQDSC